MTVSVKTSRKTNGIIRECIPGVGAVAFPAFTACIVKVNIGNKLIILSFRGIGCIYGIVFNHSRQLLCRSYQIGVIGSACAAGIACRRGAVPNLDGEFIKHRVYGIRVFRSKPHGIPRETGHSGFCFCTVNFPRLYVFINRRGAVCRAGGYGRKAYGKRIAYIKPLCALCIVAC